MPLKNILIKALIPLFKQKTAVARPEDGRFLIVSTTALGDTLWATPAIKVLREAYPENYIAMLTSPIGKEVLVNNPYIDELFVVKNPAIRYLFSLYATLKQRHFSHVFFFHTSQRPILPCIALLSPPLLIGSQGINKGLDDLFTHCIAGEPGIHEIQRRLKMLTLVGAHPTSTPEIELFLNKKDEQEADEYLCSLLLPTYLPKILFHPGAKDRFKQWPVSHFVALGKRLIAHLGCVLFISGTPEEKSLVEAIASQIEGAIPVMHLPLRSFAAFIKKMDLMVTNDTGPMHVAFAMKTPTVALFVPTDAKLCGPHLVKKVEVLTKPVSCSPCLKRKCPSSFCLLQIGVQEVYDAALKLFYETKSKMHA